MTGQISLFDWIPCVERLPSKSGMYIVRDRNGRIFRTWYERARGGFSSVYKGTGYSVTDWRIIGDYDGTADGL